MSVLGGSASDPDPGPGRADDDPVDLDADGGPAPASKILLLTHYFEPEQGAPQRRWDALIRRLVARGHEVHVIAPPPHYPNGTLEAAHRGSHRVGSSRVGSHGATVHRVAWTRHDGGVVLRSVDHARTAIATARKAMRLICSRAFEPDVIVATAPAVETLIVGSVVSRMSGVPLVTEMRDAWPDLVSYTPGLARGPVETAKAAVHRFTTALQRASAQVVTTTDAFAQVLRSRGIDDVTVIRNGTDLATFSSVAPAEPHRGLRALYLGTTGRSQGLDLIVRTAARLRDDDVHVDVRIVGAGADWRRLAALNGSLGSPVDLRRSVRHDEVAEHYGWADTVVVSLRGWEPFAWTVPSKLYELMATGKHITAIVRGESASLVAVTRAGDVVEPGDHDELARLWTRLAQAPDAGRVDDTARRWVADNVDFDRLTDAYERVLRAATARGRMRGPASDLRAD